MTIAPRFRELLPADSVVVGDTVNIYALDGLLPQCVIFPGSAEELSRCVAAADAADWAVVPVGNGTQLQIGKRPQRYDVALATRRLSRVLAHEAADMTVTVEAGATLAEVNATLGPARQHLPLDPPCPEHTTIGALIATDGCGPWRLAHGKVRDLLIGLKVVLPDGTLVKGGGRVVKNVAGYDLMKLFTGSFGTLGVVVEATFKVRPLPESEAIFALAVPDITVAVSLGLEVYSAALSPHYLEALNRSAAAALGLADSALLLVGCGGSPEEIAIQQARMQELAAERTLQCWTGTRAERNYAAVRDFPVTSTTADGTGFSNEGMVPDATYGCKLSLLPSMLAQVLSRVEAEAGRTTRQCLLASHVGSGVAYIRWCGDDATAAVRFAEWLRTTVRQAAGWAVFDRVPALLTSRIDPWDADLPGLRLMRGIKTALDPRRRFSPGRFVGGI